MAMSPAWVRRFLHSWRRGPSARSKRRRTVFVPPSAPSSPNARRRPPARNCLPFIANSTSRSASALRRPRLSAMCCPSCAASPPIPEEERVLEALRAEVLEANLELVRRGLVVYTFGNASAVSREDGLCVIKPSGVPYDEMTAAHMVITDLQGTIVEGALRPSSDLATHVALYRA